MITTIKHNLSAITDKVRGSKLALAAAEPGLSTTKHEKIVSRHKNALARHMERAKTETIVTAPYDLATDCLRLSMHFFHPIQQSAQQIYDSALPLSPTSSHLHKLYLQNVIDNQLSHVTAYSGAPDTWGSLLRTIDVRPKQLTCISTSPQRIIAVCEDIVNIYDAITFVLRQSLDAPEAVTKIQTSPDGTFLFFAHSTSVTMWDVQTGGLVCTFETKSKTNDIAASTTHIACGSSDGSVSFWNIHTKKGKGFETGQPVVTIYWLSPQRLAVATQITLYIYDITSGETLGRFSVPGHVWGMVYLEDEDAFLVGSSQQSSGVDQEEPCFIRCILPKSEPEHIGVLCWKFLNLEQSPPFSRKLLSPTLVDGDQIACIIPPNGVQVFSASSKIWTNSPPLLGAATSLAVSVNKNIVVQAKDYIQIFSVGVLASGEVHNDICVSQVYPLGGKHIICVSQPTGSLTLLELETLQILHACDNASIGSSLTDRSPSVRELFIRGLVAEFGVPAVLQAWESGKPLPGWTEAAGEGRGMALGGLSPECTWIVTVYGSPQRGLCVKDAKDGTVLANLCLPDNDVGVGEVYDLTFDSETRFYLKIDGPGWHVQIPYDVVASPSGGHPYTITKGEPVPLLEPRATPPYTLDANCEWVVDAEFRKISWISPGNIRRGDGGHFWVGLSLVMVGDDGVVRKLTFKEPSR